MEKRRHLQGDRRPERPHNGVAEGRTVISATLGSVSASCDIEVYSPAAVREFTFLQLNLWEGIANVNNGQEALIKQLAELKPDAASFCEFTSEDNARTILTAVAAELYKRTGIRYTYTCKGGSGTRGLLTRHPVLSTDAVNGNLWFYRTVVDFYGQQMAIYASHAYHMYYACYLPRGYGDGSSPYGWDKLADGPITDIDFILDREEKSGRTQIAKDLTADTRAQQAQGRLCIFGGDLNQPSHLDWTEAMKDKYEHNGCVVAWPISTTCYADGMKDAYREVYPDPVTHPAVTWPVNNKDARKETQWAADADERDRHRLRLLPSRRQVRPQKGPDHGSLVDDLQKRRSRGPVRRQGRRADRTRGRRMAQRPPGTVHHVRSAVPPIT